MNKNIQEALTGPYKVFGIEAGMDAIGWKEEEDGTITCPCGGQVSFIGFIGTDTIECDSCGRMLFNVFGLHRFGASSGGMLNPEDFYIEKDDNDDDKYWIAVGEDGKPICED